MGSSQQKLLCPESREEEKDGAGETGVPSRYLYHPHFFGNICHSSALVPGRDHLLSLLLVFLPVVYHLPG
jgi:hypothetical protein